MFARLLAGLGLLNLVVSAAPGFSNEPPGTELVVYLSTGQGQSPRVLDSLKRELGQILRIAGYDVTWRDAAALRPADTGAPVIVASLEGTCGMPPGGDAPTPAEKPESLGFTQFAGGQALPFSFVHCASLTRMLAPLLASEPPMRRDFLYGRAVARVLAHEFYHVLLGDREHAAEGVAKPTFTPADLIAERFEFEPSTLARLQRTRPATVTGETAAGDGYTGRR